MHWWDSSEIVKISPNWSSSNSSCLVVDGLVHKITISNPIQCPNRALSMVSKIMDSQRAGIVPNSSQFSRFSAQIFLNRIECRIEGSETSPTQLSAELTTIVSCFFPETHIFVSGKPLICNFGKYLNANFIS